MDKIKSKHIINQTIKNNKIIVEKDNDLKTDIKKIYNKTESESDEESGEELDNGFNLDEEYDNLEKELDNKINKNYPKNYGSKWSDKDKIKLSKYLINSKYQIFFDSDDILINKLANKFGRSVGGIKAEIRRMVFEKYINGEDIELISKTYNIIYRDVKQIIKLHLEKESDNEINILEKENKLLKLRIENIKLRDELKNITQQK